VAGRLDRWLRPGEGGDRLPPSPKTSRLKIMPKNPISRRSFMQSGVVLPLSLTLDSSGETKMAGRKDGNQEVEDLQRIVKLSGGGFRRGRARG